MLFRSHLETLITDCLDAKFYHAIVRERSRLVVYQNQLATDLKEVVNILANVGSHLP